MQLGRVIGTATATLKHESMHGQRLLVVQPQLVDGSPDGDPLLAVDGVGAGGIVVVPHQALADAAVALQQRAGGRDHRADHPPGGLGDSLFQRQLYLLRKICSSGPGQSQTRGSARFLLFKVKFYLGFFF